MQKMQNSFKNRQVASYNKQTLSISTIKWQKS